jgi:DNA-binding NarL/FixJ family response regulator
MTRCGLLSPREREVLRLLAEGQSVKQVAQGLHVSYKTVDNQTSSIMKKLQVHSRTELVRYAIREEMAMV